MAKIQSLSIWKTVVIAAAFAIHAVSAHGQLNRNEVSLNSISKSWGFYIGQMLRLERIATQQPALQNSVLLAQNEFELAFPDFEMNVERTLRSWGAQDHDIDTIRKGITNTIASNIDREPNDTQSAESFIAFVRERATGAGIPVDILSYLLAASFMARPEQEVIRGWRVDFSSLGHPKAKGVTVKLKAPKSFKLAEGDRPNIVSKWTSEDGNGLEMMMLMVLPSDSSPISRKEIDKDLSLGDRSDIRKSLSGSGKVLAIRAFSQELAAGYIADIEMETERAGIEMTLRQRLHVLFVPGKSIGFACQVGALRRDAASLAPRANRLAAPCQNVMNSIVLPQQYPGGR